MQDMERQERWDRGECSDHDSDEEENILRGETRKRDCASPVRRRLPNWQQQWVCGQTRLLQRRMTVRMHKLRKKKKKLKDHRNQNRDAQPDTISMHTCVPPNEFQCCWWGGGFNVLISTCSIKIIFHKIVLLSDIASRFLQSQYVQVGPWQIWIFSFLAVAVCLALIAACPHRRDCFYPEISQCLLILFWNL